ncbi:MAG: hypothetical protein HFK09_03880 [Clostridia bacterium]|nr:hypothetical protein [Clostridia bacterium]
MFKIKDSFKNRTIGFYLGFGAACAALAVAIVYLIASTKDMSLMPADNQISGMDRTFSVLGFILVLVGALTEVLVVFTDFKFAPVVPIALISVGTGISFYQCLPTLMDVVNGINFFGGNLGIAFAIPVVLAVTIIAMCVASFMDMRKEPA